MSYYMSQSIYLSMCVEGDKGGDGDMYMCVWRGTRKEMETCTCVCGGGPGRGWRHVHVCVEGGSGRRWGHEHVCVEGDQGGDGDMYMCVWRGTSKEMETCTCVCGRGPGCGWRHVHVCVEGGQGGYRDMYMCVWSGDQGGDGDMYMYLWWGTRDVLLYTYTGMSYFMSQSIYLSMCVEGGTREGMGTCTCVWRGPGRGWGHVHVCVEGNQGGDGDMYMCVWRGTREGMGTCTCVCGGGQGGHRDMYIIWLYVFCYKRYLKNLLPAEFFMCQNDPNEF